MQGARDAYRPETTVVVTMNEYPCETIKRAVQEKEMLIIDQKTQGYHC